jgi:DNA-binding response OmpR family regulator
VRPLSRRHCRAGESGIVLVSARSDTELQSCLHATGADDFVPKCAGTGAVVNRVLALSKDIST